MAIRFDGGNVFLIGDWNMEGAVRHIDSLSNVLQQIGYQEKKMLKVDCGEIVSVDYSGLQLLKVWLQCVRFRGLEPILVNISEGLKRVLLVTGFALTEAGLCLDDC